jgi:hypothetical protein
VVELAECAVLGLQLLGKIVALDEGGRQEVADALEPLAPGLSGVDDWVVVDLFGTGEEVWGVVGVGVFLEGLKEELVVDVTVVELLSDNRVLLS